MAGGAELVVDSRDPGAEGGNSAGPLPVSVRVSAAATRYAATVTGCVGNEAWPSRSHQSAKRRHPADLGLRSCGHEVLIALRGGHRRCSTWSTVICGELSASHRHSRGGKTVLNWCLTELVRKMQFPRSDTAVRSGSE